MKTLASKIATLLLTSVILSASCLSCLIQATPAYAATVATAEIELSQNKDCENVQDPLREGTSTIKTSLFVTPTTIAVPSSDRNTHSMKHGTDCGPTYNKTSFGIKQLQPAEHHFAVTGGTFIFHTDPIYYQWSLAPPCVLLRNTVLLTGTTIKKE